MRVIGIDPGTQNTGFGIIEEKGSHLFHIESGVIKLAKTKPLDAKLLEIQQRITDLIKDHQPDALALEEAFFAKNVRSAMVLAHARGAILLTAAMLNVPTFEYSALSIKQSTTGFGRASKEQVFDMVRRLLNMQTNQIQGLDQTDALSAAICHINSYQLQQKVDRAHAREKSAMS